MLSSNATIGEITIADREGIWLRITNARIVWTRSALLLGRLDIDTLAADSIDVLRKPLPEEGLPSPEAGGFRIPELPLSITLGNLDVPRVTFGEGVFGLASRDQPSTAACGWRMARSTPRSTSPGSTAPAGNLG